MSPADELPPPSRSATVPLGGGELIAGKYRVQRLLGAGGMGLVVLAMHTELEQHVAIKMMREEGLRDADARARFAREAKAAVRLKSEHVARVIDVGTLESGAPYLVMEYLEGDDLATVLEEHGDEGLPIDQAVAYLLQVCEAVAEAHGLGIVHRDLKPRNIFVTSGADGKPLLKVLDFGISKVIASPDGTADLALTKTTDVMGSPSYMAPEQLRAAKDADARADIWSLGVILYECITGRLPWEAESVTELGAMVLRDAPRAMRALREGVPKELEEIVLKCLEKDRDKRFASVEALAHALEPHAQGLASGSAERIASVARTSKRPSSPTVGDSRASSSALRRAASGAGGTSVSWADGEAKARKPSIAPAAVALSRTTVLVAILAVAAALVAGGYVLARRTAPATATSPVLPEDRGAIRPPPPSSVASSAQLAVQLAPAPPAASMGNDSTASSSSAPTTTAVIGSLPRHAPPPTVSSAPSAVPSAATDRQAPAAQPPDAHNMGSIPRK